MSGLDGYALTRRIQTACQADPALSLPVMIAVTASAFEEERAEALRQGCDDFVRKPVTQEMLIALLEHHLKLQFVFAETDELQMALSAAERTAALAQISADLLLRLQRATEMSDIYETEAVITSIKAEHPPLGHELAQMAHLFDYDAILALISGHLSGAVSE
jgi:CheY-like chemotaxis protein